MSYEIDYKQMFESSASENAELRKKVIYLSHEVQKLKARFLENCSYEEYLAYCENENEREKENKKKLRATKKKITEPIADSCDS